MAHAPRAVTMILPAAAGSLEPVAGRGHVQPLRPGSAVARAPMGSFMYLS